MQKKHQIIIDAINKVEGVFTNSEKKILIGYICVYSLMALSFIIQFALCLYYKFCFDYFF